MLTPEEWVTYEFYDADRKFLEALSIRGAYVTKLKIPEGAKFVQLKPVT